MVIYNIKCSNEISCHRLIGLLHVLYLYAEILEAFSSASPMTTEFTTTQIITVSTTEFNTSITMYHMSSISSVKQTTASVISITQLPQSEYLYSDYTYIIIMI